MKLKRSVFSYPYIVWMIIFIAAPMMLIGYYALTDKTGAFTLANLISGLRSQNMAVLWRSVVMALETTLVCLVLGYPVAYILSNMKRSRAAIVSMFFILPMWMNFLLRTYAWQVLLDTNGAINALLTSIGLAPQQLLFTETAILLGNIYNFLPFMILPIYTVLIKLDKSHLEAASDLGANGITTFARVILPLSMPGVISGITMVFIPAITTFAISRLLGGGMYMLYGDLIENQFLLVNEWGIGSALSFILLILVIISMLIMRNAERRTGEEGGKLW
ncbi:MAG: ABC transporter permease [Candidatus Gastranaerophilaceae bacterium]|jgi:spermidine/putrescine transport system permease protein|nr:ABC transporter permease [Christensenellales bacterium]